MKTKLFSLVALVAFLSLIPTAVLADTDPVSMWVSRVRLAYTGCSSTGTDTIVGLVHVRDANRRTVVGADGYCQPDVADRGGCCGDGSDFFPYAVQSMGWTGNVCAECVSNVTKDGWIYVPTQNNAVAASIIAR